MPQDLSKFWQSVLGSNQAKPLPRYIANPILFCYLATQEFSRNRCPEKASALGFQTVFSLIPALFLALVIFLPFRGSANIVRSVSRVVFQVLNLEDLAKEVQQSDQVQSESSTDSPPPLHPGNRARD